MQIPYYDPWESETEPTRSKIILKKLIKSIEFAKTTTPFYKNRLSQFNSKSSCPLAEIPVLTSRELHHELPPLGRSLLSREGQAYTVFQSGGTTGMPKTTLFSEEELAGLYFPNSRGFTAMGLSQADRVANLFAVGGLYMTFIHIHRMLESFGCMNFPFSNHTPDEFVHAVTEQFKINCFTGIASVVLNTLRKIHETHPNTIHLEKVFYGGEHLYEADREEIKKKFGPQVQIGAPGYGTVESWYIGYQCLSCQPGVFHAHDDQTYIEIVDENTGVHCQNNETGMLYVTAFPRKLTPVIRYRVGDRAKWLDIPCPCGRTTPLFKLLGRGDDVLRIGYDSIDYSFVQSTLQNIEGLLGSLQMEKRRRTGNDELILRVESDAPESQYEDLKTKLQKNFLDARPTLRDCIEKGTVWPIQIDFFKPNSLPKNPRTGKLIRVIDVL